MTEPMKAFPATALRNVTVMPHTFCDGLGVLAALPVPAAPGTAGTMIEWRWPPGRQENVPAGMLGRAFGPSAGEPAEAGPAVAARPRPSPQPSSRPAWFGPHYGSTSHEISAEDAAMTQVPPGHDAGIITKLSPRPVTDTVAQLTAMIAAKGIRLFAVIDQAAEARQAGLELRDTTLVIFGNPAAGTPVMEAAPLAGLDLPLKILIWDDTGHTKVRYNAPAWLAGRYHLSAELTANLTVIDPLTDALTAQ